MKRSLKSLVAMLLTLVMALGVCSPVMAAANATASITYSVYYEGESDPYEFDSATVDVTSGMTVYDVVLDTIDPSYDAVWTENESAGTVYLESLLGESAKTVDHYYAADGSGWSIDWGWIFTVNGSMPAFSDGFYKAMNQAAVSAGDQIDVTYAYVKTVWDSTGKTTFEILDPAA